MKRAMKTITTSALAALLIAGAAGCAAEKPQNAAEEGFKPLLDTNAAYTLKVVGH